MSSSPLPPCETRIEIGISEAIWLLGSRSTISIRGGGDSPEQLVSFSELSQKLSAAGVAWLCSDLQSDHLLLFEDAGRPVYAQVRPDYLGKVRLMLAAHAVDVVVDAAGGVRH